MEKQLYEMTILLERSQEFKTFLRENYSEKLIIEKEVYKCPYAIYHLHTKDISRTELALLQDKFLK